MTRSAVALALLSVLVVSQGFVQDLPGGPPVAVKLEVLDAPSPWYVAGKQALLKVVAVDQYGRPSLANGIVVGTKTSDPKSKLNNLEVGLVNGTATLKLQWFTPSDKHSIEASGTGGIKGETNGIKIQALPKGLKFKLLEPSSWPKYAWAGGYFRACGQLLTADDEPVGNVQVSFATSRGTVIVPGDVVTDPDNGDFEFDCFAPEFICPGDEGGGGGVNGDSTITVKCFVDANGNDIAEDVEPGDDMPPVTPTHACPQELIPCALRILCILEEGGVFPPPTNGDDGIIITGVAPNAKLKGKERSDPAKITAAKKFLREQVIDFVSTGKWNGKFSDVRKRIQTVITLLKDVVAAQPVVQRLDCAAELMKTAPDVRGLKLDVQDRPGQRVTLPVRSHETITVQNLGRGNSVLSPASFPGCFKPFIQTFILNGPAIASVQHELTQFSLECTSSGTISISITMAYLPLRVIVIPPENGSGAGVGGAAGAVSISASSVINHSPEVEGLSFLIIEDFTIECFLCTTELEGFKDPVVPFFEGDDPARFLKGSKRKMRLTFTQPTPKPEEVTITVKRTKGATGDADLATIDAEGKITARNSKNQVITMGKSLVIKVPKAAAGVDFVILGMKESSERHNMQLLVQEKGAPRECVDTPFTVFTVELNGLIEGKASEKIPAAAKAFMGKVDQFPLQAFYLQASGNEDRLGIFCGTGANARASAGIHIAGRILPTKMEPGDFDDSGSRFNGFDMRRMRSNRLYDGANCLVLTIVQDTNASFNGAQSADDDTFDIDEDLTPGKDLGGDDLFIHDIDVVTLSPAAIPNGQVRQMLTNFVQLTSYKGEQCSRDSFWATKLKGEVDADGDFKCAEADLDIRWGGTNAQNGSIALKPSSAPTAADIKIRDPDTKKPEVLGTLGETKQITITGDNLKAPGNCKPLAYIFFETAVPFNISNPADQTIQLPSGVTLQDAIPVAVEAEEKKATGTIILNLTVPEQFATLIKQRLPNVRWGLVYMIQDKSETVPFVYTIKAE